MQNVIEIINATKIIQHDTVLNNIDMVVKPQTIVGIRGHNGAGKSMLLRLITGLIYPTKGEVIVWGARIGKDREFPDSTGVLINTPAFLPRYSGLQNLRFLAAIQKRIHDQDIIEAMRTVGLDPENPKPVKTYSTGMKQRLGLAQAIMEKPRLLVLDEPTRGIDPDGVAEIHQILRKLRETGATILFTSHDEAEMSLCDQHFVMKQGSLASA